MYSKFLATSAIILCASAASAENAGKWAPVFELEGRINADRSLASPKFLIPLAQDDNSLLFTDIRTRIDDNSSEEYNIGLGYRQIHKGWIYGGYGFVDYLSSPNDNGYWQATAGLEMLNEDWDLRLNGYLPESDKNSLGGGGTTLGIGGGGLFQITRAGGGVERALGGFDAEVGYKLPLSAVDLRVFGGAYYFDASGFDSVSGPKARIELTLGHEHIEQVPEGVEFTLGAQYQNDGPREGTTTALAQLRIPFGGSDSKPKLSALEKRMTNFIERDVDIVTQSGTGGATTTEAAQVSINGNDYTQGAIINSSTANIGTAITDAGTGGLVIFDGNINVAASITPLAGQILTGAGQNFTVLGLDSGSSFNTTLGSRPVLTGGNSVDIFTLNGTALDNVTISGMDLVKNSGYGIMVSDGSDGHSLEDLSITENNITLAAGVYITGFGSTNPQNITISNVSIEGGVGFALSETNNITFTNATTLNTSDGIGMIDATNLSGDITTTGTTGSACADNGGNSGTLLVDGVACP